MTIRFCKKCGGMMMPKKLDDKTNWICRSCGKKENVDKNEKIVISRKVEEKKGIPVVDVDKQKDELSTIKVKCEKCEHNRALWWMQQTRSGDEPATRFFKCIGCGHIWREYS
ncbi:MAG: transcription factor S [Candidatus Altiarchaeota archaeon]|nr:transcription factor S [Candidatus Altiarchaeota archaeon]